MSDPRFDADLARFGPEGTERRVPSLAESRRYCRDLARGRYENFTVASLLLPRRLREHFYSIYAYCRWADDLADEVGDPTRSLELLAWWEEQLRECYRGNVLHPVFVALGETIREFRIPQEPFADLLVAFRRDQQVVRYETLEQLLDYCRHSANPVGRLVLHVGRCCDPERVHLSDSVCTGLQLINFWQDVEPDWRRGRVYLPRTHCLRYGYTEAMFARHECNDAFRNLLADETDAAEAFLRRGLPLVGMVAPELQLDIALFVHGGLGVVEAIRRIDYDVWSMRPHLSKWEKAAIVARCWWRLRRGTLLEESE